MTKIKENVQIEELTMEQKTQLLVTEYNTNSEQNLKLTYNVVEAFQGYHSTQLKPNGKKVSVSDAYDTFVKTYGLKRLSKSTMGTYTNWLIGTYANLVIITDKGYSTNVFTKYCAAKKDNSALTVEAFLLDYDKVTVSKTEETEETENLPSDGKNTDEEIQLRTANNEMIFSKKYFVEFMKSARLDNFTNDQLIEAIRFYESEEEKEKIAEEEKVVKTKSKK